MAMLTTDQAYELRSQINSFCSNARMCANRFNDTHYFERGEENLKQRVLGLINDLTEKANSKPKTTEQNMSKKFYQVKKENFLWTVDAILQSNDAEAYKALDENELWCVNEHVKGSATIAADIIENSPEYFERVYPVNLITKTIYKVKAEAMQFINKDFREPAAPVAVTPVVK